MRARDPRGDAEEQRRASGLRRMARALLVLEELALPVPATWSRAQARTADRAGRLAAGDGERPAGASPPRPAPLRRLPVSEHRPGVGTSAIRVRESVGGHQADLLRSL